MRLPLRFTAMAAATLIGFTSIAWAAGDPKDELREATQEALETAPQVALTIEEQPLGPELVTVTVLDPSYPEALLRTQVARLGELLQSKPRGLYVMRRKLGGPDDPGFLTAKFAIDDLVLPNGEGLQIGVATAAFLGAPAPHTVKALHLTFPGLLPAAKTLRAFRSDAAVVAGSFNQWPPAIEYRILALTQDPAALDIPNLMLPAEAVVPTETKAISGPNPLLVTLLVVAGVSGGALVYFLAVGSSRRSGRIRRPSRRK